MSRQTLSRTAPGYLLSRALQTLATGLTLGLGSESDYPFKAFCAPLPKSLPLNAETFRAAAGIGHTFKLDVSPASEFFKISEEPDQNSSEKVAAYKLLGKVMRVSLKNLTMIYVRGDNVVEVRFYLVGRLAAGSLVGLRSISVET
jgi:Nuclease A inhibitor-like protein